MSSDDDRRIASEFMTKLYDAEKMTFDLDRSLELLQQDLEAIEDGWTFNIVIDYHELHRYLHPCVDQDRNNSEKFYLAQLVLSYLFNVSPEKLILLPMYIDEFKARLGKIGSDLESLSKQEYTTRRQKEVAKLVEELSKGGDISDATRKLVYSYALDVLIKDHVDLGMNQAMNRFADLARSGKISFIEQLIHLSTDIAVDRDSEEFNQLMALMGGCRPDLEKHKPNITDAEAAIWIKKANELNCGGRQAFVLVSSAHRIKQVFGTVGFQLGVKGRMIQSTILRDLYYVLFKYYFHQNGVSTEKIIANIDETRRLFKDYIHAMEGLHQKAVEINLGDIDQTDILPLYEQVLDCLWQFETFMVERTGFEPIVPLDDEETFEKIKSVAKDSQALRECVGYALNALKSSITTIDALCREMGVHLGEKEGDDS